MTDRIVLVDDHQLIATTLAAALRQAGFDVHWCALPPGRSSMR
ncbi:MAG TPA: hypothetical protein VGH76_12770 [Actinomycetospora sp.]